MKERMLLILLVGVFMVGIVSAGNSCDDNQTIMRLYQASNSHVAFWNESVSDYTVEICYDEIFGETYTDANPHDCTGANRILSLYDVSNSHASNTTDGNYNNEVCYGDLICEYTSDACSGDGRIVARMYSEFNSHVSNASDANYLTKICCAKAIPTSELLWRDANGIEITTQEINIGDTIQAVVTGVSSGKFTIKEEDDTLTNPIDNNIKVDVDGVDVDGQLVYEWIITQADLDRADNFDAFYFKTDVTDVEESDRIAISGIYDDMPMDITIVSPNCGDNFTVGDVSIEITASDEDDFIEGNVSINGVNANSFINGGVTFVYPFPGVGNYQIVAEAVNSRGKRARHIANIIVLDEQISGKYVAACIAEPKDFSDIDTASVTFNASTTVGIEVNSSGITIVRPGENERFSWYWSFVPTGQSRNFESSSERGAYYFSVEFPTVGQNSASLRVEFI